MYTPIDGLSNRKQVLEDGPEEDMPEGDKEEHGDVLTGNARAKWQTSFATFSDDD
jgi:hypothetical protein